MQTRRKPESTNGIETPVDVTIQSSNLPIGIDWCECRASEKTEFVSQHALSCGKSLVRPAAMFLSRPHQHVVVDVGIDASATALAFEPIGGTLATGGKLVVERRRQHRRRRDGLRAAKQCTHPLEDQDAAGFRALTMRFQPITRSIVGRKRRSGRGSSHGSI